MFYNTFQSLCKKNAISCKAAATEIGLSNSITTKWKKTGAMPSGKTLSKIAEYFNVSLNSLLGHENGTDEIGMNDFTYALRDETKDLNEENQQTLLNMARYLNSKQKSGK